MQVGDCSALDGGLRSLTASLITVACHASLSL